MLLIFVFWGGDIGKICLPHRILGDPEADKGGEGKAKRAEKYIWHEEK